jgi:hypothetical protein
MPHESDLDNSAYQAFEPQARGFLVELKKWILSSGYRENLPVQLVVSPKGTGGPRLDLKENDVLQLVKQSDDKSKAIRAKIRIQRIEGEDQFFCPNLVWDGTEFVCTPTST